MWQGEQNGGVFFLREEQKNSCSSSGKTDRNLLNLWHWSLPQSRWRWWILVSFPLLTPTGPGQPSPVDCLILDQNQAEQFKKNQKPLKDCCCSFFKARERGKRNFLPKLTKKSSYLSNNVTPVHTAPSMPGTEALNKAHARVPRAPILPPNWP